MRHDHPFSQRNKTSKIAVEVTVGGNRKEGLDKILKRCDRQYWGGGGGGGRHNIGE